MKQLRYRPTFRSARRRECSQKRQIPKSDLLWMLRMASGMSGQRVFIVSMLKTAANCGRCMRIKGIKGRILSRISLFGDAAQQYFFLSEAVNCN